MKHSYYCIAVILLHLASGCTKNADLAAPEKKIVVNAQISPADDSIRVILRYSKPVNSVSNIDYGTGSVSYDPNNELAGATVTLSDNINTVTLIRDARAGWFSIAQSAFRLEAGKTYHLYVKDKHNQEVTATTTIPFPVTGVTYTVLNEQPVGSAGGGRYGTRYVNRFIFTDNQNTKHNYRLYSGLTSASSNRERVFGNYLEDGKSFTGTADVIVETTVYNLFDPVDSILKRSGYFISCSEEYFRFYQSIENINGLSNSPEILIEPVNIYSNINGGLGIFSGYNLVKVSL